MEHKAELLSKPTAKTCVRKYVQLILDSSIRDGPKSFSVPVNGLCPFHKTLLEKTLTKRPNSTSRPYVANMTELKCDPE